MQVSACEPIHCYTWTFGLCLTSKIAGGGGGAKTTCKWPVTYIFIHLNFSRK